MDEWLFQRQKEIIRMSTFVQINNEFKEIIQPALEMRRIVADRIALLESIPPPIREMITREESEWKDFSEDEILAEEQEPVFSKEEIELISYLREIYISDIAKFEQIIAEAEKEKDNQYRTGKNFLQKGKSGRSSDPLYDKAHEKMTQENLSRREAYNWYWQEAGIKEPDRHLWKSFYSAMWRRDQKVRNST